MKVPFFKDNIQKDAIIGIHDAINKVVDEYVKGETSGTRIAKSIIHRQDYDNYFDDKQRTLEDAKKEFLKPLNFTNLLIDIKYINFHLFNSRLEYRNTVKQILEEILEDRLSLEKDKKLDKVMENENIKSFEEIINENTDDIKSFETFYTNVEKNAPIYEIKLPVLKIEEILNNVNLVTNDTLKRVLVTFFKTYVEYIDMIDKRKHLYKINDMSGDIMNNNRIVFNAAIFEDNDLVTIKNNIVDFAMSELYSSLPDVIDVFAIQIKPMSFLNKEDIKQTFEAAITNDEVVNIITNILGFTYNGKYQSFYIWSNKK